MTPHRHQWLRPHRPPDPEGHARAASRTSSRWWPSTTWRRHETNAHLFKYDSTYGRYRGRGDATDEATSSIDGYEIRAFSEKDPAALPWRDLGVDIVIESTGIFTDATKAQAHLDAGAKKVIISAPAKNEDITLVLGVNEDALRPGEAPHRQQRVAARRTGSPCRPR